MSDSSYRKESDGEWEEVASVKTLHKDETTPDSDRADGISGADPKIDFKETLRKSSEAAGPSRRLVNRLLTVLVIVLGIILIAAAVLFVMKLKSLLS